MTTLKILQQLIGINSVTGAEGEILEWIKSYLVDLGFNPFFVKGNLVVLIKGKIHDKALIFNAHVDTVPSGDEQFWKIPPFSGRLKKGKVFGLGASDDKATVATLLLLAKKLIKNKPNCDVWLTFVINEEIDGSGTQQFVSWFSTNHRNKYHEVAAILGEPTGLSKVDIGHKGNIFVKITIFGNSGHGSAPEKIHKHAVLEMYKLAKRIEKLEGKWKQKYQDSILGKPTIGLLTSIQAGDIKSPNKFPDSCTATFDIRTTPRLHNISMKELTAICPDAKIEFVCEPGLYGYTESEENIAQIMHQSSQADFGIFEGANDQCFFTKVGIPAVIFGPGETSVMHQPDEYCELKKIEKCLRIYIDTIKNYGGTDAGNR